VINKHFRLPDIVYLKLIDPIIRELYVKVLLSLQTGGVPLTRRVGKDTYLYLTKYRDSFLVGLLKFF